MAVSLLCRNLLIASEGGIACVGVDLTWMRRTSLHLQHNLTRTTCYQKGGCIVMRCGRVSCRSWVLAIFLLLAFSFSDHVYSGRSLNVSSCCRQIWKTQVLLSTAERRVFTYGLQVTSWFFIFNSQIFSSISYSLIVMLPGHNRRIHILAAISE